MVLAGVTAGVLLPLMLCGLLVLVEPPAVSLVGTPPTGTFDLLGGRTLILSEKADPRAARRLATERYENSDVPISQVNDLYRYRTHDGRRGLIVAVDRYLLQVEADSDAAIEATIRSNPYLVRNSGILAALFDQHLVWFIAGILGYAAFCAALYLRGLSWAATTHPVRGQDALSEGSLRARLLSMIPPGRVVHDDPRELIIHSPRSDVALRLRFDAHESTVRAVLTHHHIRASGRTFRWAVFRTIPTHGGWTQSIASEVVAAGWTWRPVLLFSRLAGG